MIGGGISSYGPLIGHACENILSARIVVASGDVNRDLLWAIRGAGQFFGVVTDLILRTYDPSLIGPNGEHQLGMIYYPPNALPKYVMYSRMLFPPTTMPPQDISWP